ncbi:MAG: MBOAT family protein [Ruminiclostridium sp.]|nr:MBOAT family protein [Ruminiclostridium sp.]
MVFSSLVFIFLFLTGTLTLYYLAPKCLKNTVILLSGLVFYTWGEPVYVVVMIISTLIDYFAGLVIWKFGANKVIRRICLIVSLVMNLSLLFIFKYSGFFADNVNAIAGQTLIDIEKTYFLGLDFLPVNILPIGISFFTFQSMSYTIDMYRGEIEVQKNPINFAAFVTLFSQLVAGPIVRYSDISKELNDRTINIDKIYEGVKRFITGMGKKVLIANSVGALWDTVLADVQAGAPVSALTAWTGIIAYTLQIYFDFSGYSDMAIGLGKMMGFTFPENFNYPYLSKSISEFWRRWHMTLGAWFRSYVYIPLGGNRKGMGRTVFNLAVVWLLTGIWHGADWTFILWGVLYGVFIIAERLFLGKVLDKLPDWICWLYTMLLVMFGWVLFASPNIAAAGEYFAAMFGSSGVLFDNTTVYLLVNYGIVLVLGIFGATDAWKIIVQRAEGKFPAVVHGLVPVCTTGIFVLCTAYLVDATYNPFLYFNF